MGCAGENIGGTDDIQRVSEDGSFVKYPFMERMLSTATRTFVFSAQLWRLPRKALDLQNEGNYPITLKVEVVFHQLSKEPGSPIITFWEFT